MSEADKPDLAALAQMREAMMARLEEGEGDAMEGLSLERLRDAMYRPNALEVMREMFASGPGAANQGMDAPDFELPFLPGHGGQEGETVQLSEHFGKRPVGLVFGSYTWPPFRAQAGSLNQIYRKYRDQVDFYVVYIKEIHSSDGWQVAENEEDAVLVRQHQSMQERVEVGQSCMLKLALEMPALVDEMDDEVAKAYAAMPERLYLVGRDGKVAYQGGLGPMYFRPAEWDAAIEGYLESAS